MNLNVFTVADATKVAEKVKLTGKTAGAIATDGQEKEPGKTPQVSADDTYTKLLKYVPVPLLGFYLAIEGTLLSGLEHYNKVHKVLFFKGSTKEYICWATLVVFAALVPWYLQRNGVKRPLQLTVSAVCFVALAAASQGPFQLWDDWKAWIGSVALFVAGTILYLYNPDPLPDDVIGDVNP
jgi:hypothetical protein